MKRYPYRSHALAALAAFACTLSAFPAQGASQDRTPSRSCASATSSASGGNATSAASAQSVHEGNRPAQQPGNMSSSVTAGPGGLTGTTTMPDGSTVTVAPGQRVSRLDAGCSGEDARVKRKPAKKQQNGRQPNSQKENRR